MPRLFGHYPNVAAAALAQAQEDHTAVLDALHHDPDMPDSGRRLLMSPLALPMLVEALVATGRLDRAETALKDLRDLARELP
ncbi:hypothetical protein ACFYPT_39465 [Streptomyces sp. NPDC005529]|uniref:hypothetical protein n=1 Tax=unclassified Streptomyces TaxID=2593676 RepID=UPI0033AB5B1A